MVDKNKAAPNKKRKFDLENVEDLNDQLSVDTLDALSKSRAKPTKRSKVDRTSYPEDSKAIYLKLKKLYVKKLRLASHIRETTAQLKDAKFPHVKDFKCAPLGAGGDLDYLTEWASIVSCCKKDLTLLYLEHLKANYRDVKNEINLNLFQLEELLDDEQYKEVISFLKTGYKMAGTKAAERAKSNFLEAPPKRVPKKRDTQNQGKPRRPPVNQRKPSAGAVNTRPRRRNQPNQGDESVQQLAALLSKVLSNKK
jgi:hypothetical protein